MNRFTEQEISELRRRLRLGSSVARLPASAVAAAQLPVGFVYVSVVSTNPASLLGYGTWAAVGTGRVLVGIDAGDADFDTVRETGGAKTVAAAGSNANESAHTHSVTSNVTVADHTLDYSAAAGLTAVVSDVSHEVTNNAVTSGAGSAHTHAFTGSATSVVQPYFVVYMWERTA